MTVVDAGARKSLALRIEVPVEDMARLTTADEIPDPNRLRVRSWVNGEPRQDYSTAGAEYTVPEIVDLATTIMTLHTGDVIAAGTSLNGTGPIQAGDAVEVEIEGIGRLALRVSAEHEVRAA